MSSTVITITYWVQSLCELPDLRTAVRHLRLLLFSPITVSELVDILRHYITTDRVASPQPRDECVSVGMTKLATRRVHRFGPLIRSGPWKKHEQQLLHVEANTREEKDSADAEEVLHVKFLVSDGSA